MTKTKCTGCKVFTMCLGDPYGFITTDPVFRCGYCERYHFGSFSFSGYEFCTELHLAVLEGNPHERERYMSCNDIKCLPNQEEHQRMLRDRLGDRR